MITLLMSIHIYFRMLLCTKFSTLSYITTTLLVTCRNLYFNNPAAVAGTAVAVVTAAVVVTVADFFATVAFAAVSAFASVAAAAVVKYLE